MRGKVYALALLLATHDSAEATPNGIKAGAINRLCSLSDNLKAYTTYTKTAIATALTAVNDVQTVKQKLILLVLHTKKLPTQNAPLILSFMERTISQAILDLKQNAPTAVLAAAAAALSSGRIDEYTQLLYNANTNQPGLDKYCVAKDTGASKADPTDLGSCISEGKWKTKITDVPNTVAPSYATSVPNQADAQSVTAHTGQDNGCMLLSSASGDGFGVTSHAGKDILVMGGIFKLGTTALAASPFKDVSATAAPNTPLEQLKAIDHSQFPKIAGPAVTILKKLASLGKGADFDIPDQTIQKADYGLGAEGTLQIASSDFKKINTALQQFEASASDGLQRLLTQLPSALLSHAAMNCTVQSSAGGEPKTTADRSDCNSHAEEEACRKANCNFDGSKKPKCFAKPSENQSDKQDGESRKKEQNATGSNSFTIKKAPLLLAFLLF
uniref:Variant surface glycoprotein 1125.4862 n=1 Tax=Trypanosoma brucei TaxID=5691 RepID=A0A1J0RBJ5_9TRYP|nr:variant surface glycoprotein 1125.4862 [Trypanosoma brucei]